ncbi:hypothetical protein PIB30_062248 [Stylosanthes scabra]|uniref:Uncharacterized protein n=1 Tax=Stylosanthes scabra TaxID=79078 RepID=A0ABU6VP98_9FABA|nr:hypothetical protein [Stylosanthes scabra]
MPCASAVLPPYRSNWASKRLGLGPEMQNSNSGIHLMSFCSVKLRTQLCPESSLDAAGEEVAALPKCMPAAIITATMILCNGIGCVVAGASFAYPSRGGMTEPVAISPTAAPDRHCHFPHRLSSRVRCLPLPLLLDVVPQPGAPFCYLQLRRVVFISVVPASPSSGRDLTRLVRETEDHFGEEPQRDLQISLPRGILLCKEGLQSGKAQGD